jgi:hypothetical protein
MKKSDKKAKKKDKGDKRINDFVAFGNRKKVFWTITIATIILSIIGAPVMIYSQKFMINSQDFLKSFLVIWILEIIYIAFWIKWGEKKKKK